MKEKDTWKTLKSIFSVKNIAIMAALLLFVGVGVYAAYIRGGQEEQGLQEKAQIQKQGNVPKLPFLDSAETKENETREEAEDMAKESKTKKNSAGQNTAAKEKTAKEQSSSSDGNMETKEDTTAVLKTEILNPNTMDKPVLGQSIREYTDGKLIYSKTLDQWVSHKGVDFSAAIGSDVTAVMDGVVTKVGEDPKLGYVVEVTHSNNMVSVYGNLEASEIVQKDQEVKKGDLIGRIGTTAAFEVLEGPHLHFELWENGKHIDPLKYLPGKVK